MVYIYNFKKVEFFYNNIILNHCKSNFSHILFYDLKFFMFKTLHKPRVCVFITSPYCKTETPVEMALISD